MTRLLIATNNPGKVRELQELLAELPVPLVRPYDLGITTEVAETGATYAENARLKAEALAAASGLIALGDDSGLEVDALGGAPGLHSARYAGPGATDADRRAKLIQALREAPAPRAARFRCVIAVAVPAASAAPAVHLFEGTCEGEILLEERGQNGFGYDPLFWLPDQGRTMAELPNPLKNRLSHRGRAVQAALPWLHALLTGA
ncbi:MAG: RdgB/HAM1 family non-canonical purine NTP pyrophosphatase [Anaerolineales bacterium]|nr:RdgB/HAM1 family non-canonical purine NTP pyrophosphatase [Anaerolineales bacterium]